MAKRRNGKTKPYPFFAVDEVQKHNTAENCWVVENGNVFDVTSFITKHPGGSNLILSHAGKDITNILESKSSHVHSANAYNLLRDYQIGKIVGNNDDVNDRRNAERFKEFSKEGQNEELIDWNHGLVAQVHKLGYDYMKWVNEPVTRQLRLFDSDFIEFFSKTPWYFVPIVWIPVVLFCCIISVSEIRCSTKGLFEDVQNPVVHSSAAFGLFCLCFVIGIPVWTLVEYILHRHLFHLEPKGNSPFLITLHFFLHGQHHKVPYDGNRLVFPPVAAAVFALFFHTLLTNMMVGGFGRAVFSGGLLGYIGYDLLHYYFHHGNPTKGSYLHTLKHYHVLHHFDDHSTGFGISTKFWDYPFSTVNKKVS